MFLLMLGLSSAPAFAESLSCPEKTDDVTVDAGSPTIMVINGQEKFFPNGAEPDMGGDYDENAPQYEWNFLNSDKYTTPAIAHCLSHTKPQQTIDIEIPPAIKRCIQPKGGEFTCQSGTISCVGYVDFVQLEATEKNGAPYQIEPSVPNDKNGKQLVWKNLDENRNGATLVAHCSERSLPKSISTLAIPEDMKECALVNRRFRCTATPDQYDLFWPKE